MQKNLCRGLIVAAFVLRVSSAGAVDLDFTNMSGATPVDETTVILHEVLVDGTPANITLQQVKTTTKLRIIDISNPTPGPIECLVDRDGDGFTESEGDCNDDDLTVFPGATEFCDKKDNDCDGAIDEGFDVGASCTVGTGACQRSGTKVCKADGSGTQCSATPGTPGIEVCNGIDDDCDGVADEGDACLICTTKTSKILVEYDGDGAILTFTNPCTGNTLNVQIDTLSGNDGTWFACTGSLAITQGTTQFFPYDDFLWKYTSNEAWVCDFLVAGITADTVIEVELGSTLDFRQPFSVFLSGTKIIEFP